MWDFKLNAIKQIKLLFEHLTLRELFKTVFLKLINIKDAYLLLNKALYKLKQAPREWFFIIKQFFDKLRLKLSNGNLNLFIREGVYILLFINDMLIVGVQK